MKLKICGMKYEDNVKEVSALNPDFLGFIFYEKSPRYFTGPLESVPAHIQRIGVFVTAEIDLVVSLCQAYHLSIVQLHGNEDPAYCKSLLEALHKKGLPTKLMKVFSVMEDFDFDQLEPFEGLCDFYLFDTKGALPGGNGYEFDWNVLKNYPSQKPYFLSGGIGLSSIEKLEQFKKTAAATYCYALDVNSRFEIKPGLKDLEELKKLSEYLSL